MKNVTGDLRATAPEVDLWPPHMHLYMWLCKHTHIHLQTRRSAGDIGFNWEAGAEACCWVWKRNSLLCRYEHLPC